VLVLGEAARSRQALALEQQRSEQLLLNVLPAPIAARLKAGESLIADAFPEVTVLFADLVDFTRRSQRSSPAQVVATLNELFSSFDALAQRHRLEKIKTIGNAYMVAGGLPDPRPDHAEAIAEMALAMQAEMTHRADCGATPSTPRAAWSPTGSPGCIQVTASTYQRLRELYQFQRWGPIPVRGKGEMVTYLLLGRNR
jgi:class 3 adenylate cyclase